MKLYEVNYKIKSKFNNKYIVLSDFHGYFPLDLAKKINSFNAEYIIICGDILNGMMWNINYKVNAFKNFLKTLNKKHTIIVSLGNHDLVHLSSKGLENFYSLKDKNIYPIFNESITIDNECFVSFVPSKNNYSYFKQDSNKTIDSIINEFKKINVTLNKSKTNHLVSHNPYHFFHKKFLKYLEGFDLIETGHFHDGWIPTRTLDKHYDEYIDKSLHEAFNTSILGRDYNSISVKPKRILSRGVAYISKNGYYTLLPNDKIYYFDRNRNKYSVRNKDELKYHVDEEKTPALVIAGAVNTFLKLPFYYPHITVVETYYNKGFSANAKIKE